MTRRLRDQRVAIKGQNSAPVAARLNGPASRARRLGRVKRPGQQPQIKPLRAQIGLHQPRVQPGKGCMLGLQGPPALRPVAGLAVRGKVDAVEKTKPAARVWRGQQCGRRRGFGFRLTIGRLPGKRPFQRRHLFARCAKGRVIAARMIDQHRGQAFGLLAISAQGHRRAG